jgi:AcrR family transcriptional regulator
VAADAQRAERRTDALSKERIIDSAIEILEARGESALTFRELKARLSTGNGAMYHHVANKAELLAAATGRVIGATISAVPDELEPVQALRALALGLFDAITAHPWVGTQLSRGPGQPSMLHIFEAIGSRVEALGVSETELFDSAFTVVNYVLGVAAQNAGNALLVPRDGDRAALLGSIAQQWTGLDSKAFPFLHAISTRLAEHDDREQFIAGVDLILVGIDSRRSHRP